MSNNKNLEYYKRVLKENTRTVYRYSFDPFEPLNHYDEIFENCYLGDGDIAQNKQELKQLGITHVLNASKGEKFSQVDTNQCYYEPLNIKFMGCSLMDVDNCKIEKYFAEASDFIHDAINYYRG